MADLFQNFTLPEIILCVIGIIVAIDWLIKIKNNFKGEFDKSVSKQEKENDLYNEVDRIGSIQKDVRQSVQDITSAVNSINSRIDKNTDRLNNVCDSVARVDANVKNLSENDRTIIKAQISDKHKIAMKEGIISEYDLEICERMYECYKRDHGSNSFIEKFMVDLRNLPNEKE